MQIKTSELSGAALDWVVATCEGHQWRCPGLLKREGLRSWLSYEEAWGNPHSSYSTSWLSGGPIIERERMQIAPLPDNGWRAHWRSFDHKNWREVWMDCFDEGVTPLIAAMRCLVASKLGDEVDIPEELLR